MSPTEVASVKTSTKAVVMPEGVAKFRKLHPGMGQAVAERTVLRRISLVDGHYLTYQEVEAAEKAVEEARKIRKKWTPTYVWENWGQVAHRVAKGNASLLRDAGLAAEHYEKLSRHLANGTTLLSGRHLQHGDEGQSGRTMEAYTNCSTSATTFMLFYLLLNGSGVGRSYDDDMMLVDWDNAPTVRCVISEDHPDFDLNAHESVRDAKHKYGSGDDVLWFNVPDTREGWAKALELWEVAAFEKIHKDKMLILDFSAVRAAGTPIMGMQGRPASGPVPLMDAFDKANTIKGARLKPWLQALYIDHYFAECVLVGGARRSARMATKFWKDKTVLEFIRIKRPIEFLGKDPNEVAKIRNHRADHKLPAYTSFLWSANNSVIVDEEFWTSLDSSSHASSSAWTASERQARAVFDAITECSYGDGTGEPGIINGHKFTTKNDGIEELTKAEYVHSRRYTVDDDTQVLLKRLAKRVVRKSYNMICNPCQPNWAPMLTPDGIRPFSEIKAGSVVWSGKRWTRVEKKWSTGVKPVYAYRTTAGVFYGTDKHRVVSGGEKVEIGQADAVDACAGDVSWQPTREIDPQDVMDGLVLGDGSAHKASNGLIYLTIGQDDGDYHKSEVAPLIGDCRPGIHDGAWEVKTCIESHELPKTYERSVPARYLQGDRDAVRGFLRGLYSANGSVCGARVTLKAASFDVIEQVQLMLSSLGIASYYTTNKAHEVEFANGTYECKQSYDLNIGTVAGRQRFADLIGFIQVDKERRLAAVCAPKEVGGRGAKPKVTYDIVSTTYLGEEEVFDMTVEDVDHTYWTGGLLVSNCGEITLMLLGGFCVIGDVVPFHAETLDEAEEAFRVTTRALMLVNTMDSVYSAEVYRTNRIGVGMTGVHEFAWKFFKLGFRDLIDEDKSKPFWEALKRFSQAVNDEAESFSKVLGVTVPHTNVTIKPAGTTSKLFGLTEGWHLPAVAWYMRWVQFRNDDPLVAVYKEAGYPTRALVKYEGTTIVGFPTQPRLTELGLGDAMVTAAQATPAEQYQWLRLGEKYWLCGANANVSNQISYTLKYDPALVDLAGFKEMVRVNQRTVKACSVMPQEEAVSYEYQPEQPMNKAAFEAAVRQISAELAEEVDRVHVDCAGGACPINFEEKK